MHRPDATDAADRLNDLGDVQVVPNRKQLKSPGRTGAFSFSGAGGNQ
jgi:hypothetical protein